MYSLPKISNLWFLNKKHTLMITKIKQKITALLMVLSVFSVVAQDSQVLSITTTVCGDAEAVNMTGPWWGWDAAAGPAALNNGDGTWTFTFDPAPDADMEYLLVVDGMQEDLVAAGTASEDWSCTPITDYWSYANRQWTVGSGNLTNVFGTCGTECPTVDPEPTMATVEFTVDMNGVDQPSAEYAQVTVNGSWNGWNGWGAELFDADGDGVWTGSLEVEAGTSFEYVVAVSGEADMYSGWGMQWGDGCGNANVMVVAGEAGSVTSTSLTPGCADVLGCIDENATNYDSAATAQQLDQYGNLSCLYASCDDVPEFGCIYADGFGIFNATFGADNCVTYGGSPCSEPTSETSGCMDSNATNYDASATVQALDQYGNLNCIFTSCDDIPEFGCIYADGFGAFNAEFNADLCTTYGGTPCADSLAAVSGCTDITALNYNTLANLEDGSCTYDTTDSTSSTALTITTTVCSGANSVSMTGPWWGWDATAGPVAIDNGDGTWTFTFDPAPDANMEYLLVVDGMQEDLVAAGAASEDWSCTPITDYWSYANREWMVGTGNVTNVYGTCGACEDTTPEVYGCLDILALNYNALATIDDGSCTYEATDSLMATVEFTVDMNGVDQPSAEYAQVTVNGSWNGWNGWGAELFDADGDGVWTGSLEVEAGTSFEYVVAVSGEADMYSGWGMQWGDGCADANVMVTAGEAESVTYTSLTPGCDDVLGCIDVNATNYDADATAQQFDQYGNLSCIYASCDDVPEFGCIYADGFGIFNGSFGAEACVSYGGTPCAEVILNPGCIDSNATNYDENAVNQSYDQYGNSSCIYASCDAIPEDGCIYSDGFGAFNEEFNAEQCVTYGGTPCTTESNGPEAQIIDLVSGWSIFSTYMIPVNMDIAAVLAPVVENIVITKNYLGSAYLPEWNFNGIGDLVIGQAYQIKTTVDSELTIDGAYAFPEENAVALSAGWNMVGYLRTEAASVDLVFADMVADGNLVIAKNYLGSAFLPEWNFNGIGDMLPGAGYQVKTIEEAMLQFLSNDDSYRLSAMEVVKNNTSLFAKAAITDNNMTVVIEDAAWDVRPTEGAEIAAYDTAGNLVGSAKYTSPLTVITVWGDDATTLTKEGLAIAEAVTFKVRLKDLTSTFDVSVWTEGSSEYQVNAINVASEIGTNLVSNSVAAERVLVKVINVLGQEVSSNEQSFKGEILFKVYNNGTVEKVVK